MSVTALIDHARHERQHPVEYPVELDPEDTVPVLSRELVEHLEHGRSGVVAQQVHRPELTVGSVGERLDRIGIADVGGHRDGLAPGCLDLVGDSLGGLRVDVGHHDVHACVGESQC